MERLGRDAKVLLCGIFVVGIVASFMVFGISSMLIRSFQQKLILHDYAVAGYQINHENDLIIAAFTADKTLEDVVCGQEALDAIGYHIDVSPKWIPVILEYRNQTLLSLFLLLLFLFGTICLFLFWYLYRQRKVVCEAELSIQKFLDGDTMCRIESEQTGDWYSLFHEINELSSILTAHAEKEKATKEFLQNIISDVSHQIKTPLAALKMYCEIMDSKHTDPEVICSFSQKSLREIKRMEDVVYTLLKLARLDAGIIHMEKSWENVSVLVQDVLERFEVWAQRERKTITVSGKEDVLLYCDALWFSEAIGNIVKNALEHTEPGGHISIQWTQTPFMIQMIMKDNGKGIHPEDLYYIFKRFYRSRFSQNVHGVGLGLPLAKAIIEAHNGTISVTSRLGVGTTFALNFFNLTNK